MRVIFMGTPEFAVPALNEISRSGFELVAIYTRQPARGGRRGLEIRKTRVHAAADSLGVPVFTPSTLRDAEVQKAFRAFAADVAVVSAYGLILPVPVLEAPKLGCLNLHASLLPRWRGAAPIQRAIMAGDKETGVDIMLMEAGLDTGPVGLREIIPIRPADTAGDLTSRLSTIAARLAVGALHALEAGRLTFEPQPAADACYARKIEKAEAEIDWTQASETVRNRIHGLSPAPGAFSRVVIGDREESVKFFRAEVAAGQGRPARFSQKTCGSPVARARYGFSRGSAPARLSWAAAN